MSTRRKFEIDACRAVEDSEGKDTAPLEDRGPLGFPPDDVGDDALILSITAVDQSGGTDKAPLIAVLKQRGHIYLADMLERYELKRPARRKPRTPIYTMTKTHTRYWLAKSCVESGMDPTEAAARYGIKKVDRLY
jgi:hypothetical protein